MAPTDIGLWKDYVLPAVTAQEEKKKRLPRKVEMESEFYATALPLEFMAPDINIAGYGEEGRCELSTH
jgi:hypothetical protein